MKRVSMRDIAAKMGVSPMTVSLVLNGKPGVSEETKLAVLKAAQEMGFGKDSSIAFGGISHRSRRHLVVFNGKRKVDYANEMAHLYKDLYFLLLDRLDRKNVEILLVDAEDQRFEADLAMADVIVELDSISERSQKISQAPRVCAFFETPGEFSVCPDNEVAGRMAAELLVGKLHHRRIAAFSRVPDHDRRIEAMIARCKSLNADVKCERIQTGTCELRVVEDVLKRPFEKRPTAIFANYGCVVMNIFKAAAALDIHIPSEMSILGFDDFPLYGWLPIEVRRLFFTPDDFADALANAVLSAIEGGSPMKYVVPIYSKSGASCAEPHKQEALKNL